MARARRRVSETWPSRILDNAIEIADIPLERRDPSIIVHERSQFLKLVRHLRSLQEGYVVLRHREFFFLMWGNRTFVFES